MAWIGGPVPPAQGSQQAQGGWKQNPWAPKKAEIGLLHTPGQFGAPVVFAPCQLGLEHEMQLALLEPVQTQKSHQKLGKKESI
jgi:hypothetical protein